RHCTLAKHLPLSRRPPLFLVRIPLSTFPHPFPQTLSMGSWGSTLSRSRQPPPCSSSADTPAATTRTSAPLLRPTARPPARPRCVLPRVSQIVLERDSILDIVPHRIVLHGLLLLTVLLLLHAAPRPRGPLPPHVDERVLCPAHLPDAEARRASVRASVRGSRAAEAVRSPQELFPAGSKSVGVGSRRWRIPPLSWLVALSPQSREVRPAAREPQGVRTPGHICEAGAGGIWHEGQRQGCADANPAAEARHE
ncbi:hypothetical protein T484DRAFT_3640001, partial [Baffinella frigidus]